MKNQQTEILLESGTNEVEIFEFRVNSHCYGVNALKVKQVLQYEPSKVHEMPMMPTGVKGNFLFRDQVIKILDVRSIFGMAPVDPKVRSILILCEFNHKILGFVVDEIVGIQRVNWSQVESPSPLLKTMTITGVALVNERKVAMLDLESMMVNLFGDPEENQEITYRLPDHFKILVADDSPVIRKKMKWILEKMNCRDIELFENGLGLYNRFLELNNENQKIDLILTDIEMPQLDGFACCKKIKSLNPGIPVVIVSSLINDQIARKCKEVGADVAINKEEFSKLGERLATLFPEKRSEKKIA
jgi:two-component system chemotaxis response regulator CheV